MLHTIKNEPKDFNLLFLSDTEYLISSLKCYYLNMQTRKMEQGILHLGTRSISIQPNDLNASFITIKLNESPLIRTYTSEEISSFNPKYIPDSIQKDSAKQSYLAKNAIMRKFSAVPGLSSNSRLFNSNNMSSNPQETSPIHKYLSNNRTSFIRTQTGGSSHNVTKKSLENSNITNPNMNSNGQANTVSNTNGNLGSVNTLKFGNFSEVINKVLKETVSRASTMKGKDILGRAGSVSIYQTINTETKNNAKSHINDLIHFFSENGFNFVSFYELMKSMKDVHSNSETKYEFLLLTANKYTLISRNPISMYDYSITSKTFFIAIEGETQLLSSFNEDKKYIIDNIHKNIFDDTKEIQSLINKKVNDLYESIVKSEDKEIITKIKCNRILPEGIQHGVFVISKIYHNEYIEFYPVINNYKRKNLKVLLSKVEALVPYRYLYKMRGINIILYQSQRSKIFVFESEVELKTVDDYLNHNCPNIDKNFTNIHVHTDLWSKGLITNYDYLLYLNIMASRSFSDLSQYPVFPWVITNYEDQEDFDISEEKNYRDLSKPIGALNREKLAKFTEKYLNDKTNYSTNEPPYLYPIHYSSPLIIMFYLNRKLPRFQLQTQGGVFDSRMLDSIKDFWEYLYSDGNDVMELIPEFYNGDGDFLINIFNLQYGKPKNGKLMNDVQLPQWAKTPKDFIRINRSALESEYVSNNLSNWIDLIFGYKQRGEMAEMHENLYRPSTYDDYVYDEFNEKKKYAEIVNISLSGQTPKQLFLCPHPKKRSLDVLNYELQLNPQEVIATLQKYKKDNELLENNYKKMLQSKYEENEHIINEHKEIEKKRVEKIEQLRRELNEKDKEYKEVIDKMIEENSKLKQNFDSYDKDKDKFIQDYIANVEESNKNDIKK